MPVSQWYGIVEFNVEWNVKLYYTIPYHTIQFTGRDQRSDHYATPPLQPLGYWHQRAVATLPQVNLEHLVVKEKVGRSVVKVKGPREDHPLLQFEPPAIV